MLMFQMPAFVCTLNGNFYRVITVFTVNCGNGRRKTRLFPTVDGIERSVCTAVSGQMFQTITPAFLYE